MSNNPYAQQPSSSQGGQVYTESNRNPWTGGIHNHNQENAAAYKAYVEAYPDLMADYEQNWAGKGVTMSEYGQMHYEGAGQAEGRQLGGASSGGGGAGGGSWLLVSEAAHVSRLSCSSRPPQEMASCGHMADAGWRIVSQSRRASHNSLVALLCAVLLYIEHIP